MNKNYGLPYGLCKKYGIELPDGATPKDAWDALRNATGYTPERFYELLREGGGFIRKLSEQKEVGNKEKLEKKENVEKSQKAKEITESDKGIIREFVKGIIAEGLTWSDDTFESNLKNFAREKYKIEMT